MNLSTLVRYGLLGAMGAGASALVPDAEAEAAMLPGARKKMVKTMMGKYKKPPDGEKVRLPELKKPSVEIGSFEESLFKKELEKAYPGVNNRVFTNTHDLGKRFNQRGQSVRETLNQYQAVLDAKYGRHVPNFSKESHAAPYGMLVHDGKSYLFTPTTVRHGDLYLNGIMRPDSGQLKKLRDGGWLSSSYPVRAGSNPGAPSFMMTSGAQPWPISAVIPQAGGTVQQSGINVNDGTGNPYFRSLGLGTRAALEGVFGLPAMLNYAVNGVFGTNLRNPGESVADWLGLPKPVPGTAEDAAFGIQSGIAEAVSDVASGTGLATLPGKIGRAGKFLSSTPFGQTVAGGILGLLGSDAVPKYTEDETPFDE